eukprot:7211978-Heterocapsa_arctica.AAC.1
MANVLHVAPGRIVDHPLGLEGSEVLHLVDGGKVVREAEATHVRHRGPALIEEFVETSNASRIAAMIVSIVDNSPNVLPGRLLRDTIVDQLPINVDRKAPLANTGGGNACTFGSFTSF